jgi:hypothetical protein
MIIFPQVSRHYPTIINYYIYIYIEYFPQSLSS